MTWRTRRERPVSLTELLVTVVSAFGVYSLLLLATESFYSRTLLVTALALSVIAIALSVSFRRSILLGVVIVVGVAAIAMQALGPRPKAYFTRVLGLDAKPHASRKVINTVFYGIDALTFSNYFDVCSTEDGECRPPGTGGGVALFEGGYLLATGEGALFHLAVDPVKGTLRTRTLASRIPINSAEYEAAVGANVLNTFRVTDILVQPRGQRFALFAAHHYWKTDQKCGVLRVSRTEGDFASVLAGNASLTWQTVFETQPCLPATGGNLTRGSESGGRMALLDENRLLLTVGDHEYDGVSRKPVMAQDPTTSYGKTILVNLSTGSAQVYTLGHRNPQGLYVDPAGVIWSTEHGPKGGDELNVIVRGANYGWPLVTHGAEYGMRIWPSASTRGGMRGFQHPVFAWVDSIAVSNLIGVERDLFPVWRGDLLIASFKKTIYRARLHEGHVTYLEAIEVPGRVRDLLEDPEGAIVVYLDGGTLMVLRPIAEAYGTSKFKNATPITDEMRGQLLFANCSGCHRNGDGTAHGIGPDLGGLAGRAVAGAPAFGYSKALSGVSGKVDRETASMRFSRALSGSRRARRWRSTGVSDPADRAALIRYLGVAK